MRALRWPGGSKKPVPDGPNAASRANLTANRDRSTSLADTTPDQLRYAFQIRTGQIKETIGLAVHSAVTHIAVAASIYWLWKGQPRAFLIPFCCFVFLTEAGVLVGKWLFERSEPTRRTVDIACRWAEAVAFIQGLTWGSMPIALLVGADPDHRNLALAILTGLIGGVFVVGSTGRIAILYLAPLVAGCFIALLIEHQPVSSLLSVLLAIYSLFVMTSVLRMNDLATRRILDRLRVNDQRETIGLLLNDFEENTSDWLWETDHLGRLIHVSDRMTQAARLGQISLLHRYFVDIFDLDVMGHDPSMGGEQLKAAMGTRAAFRDLTIGFERDRISVRWTLSGKPLFDGSGGFVGFRGVGSDVTKTMQAQQRIAYLAKHDFLTGLTNRAHFRELLAQAADTYDATSLAVLSVDLDDFKIVNDTFGHVVGDEVLLHATDRLRRAVPSGAVIGRLGGDEFALLLRPASENDAIDVARAVIESLGQACQCKDLAIVIGASVGIAVGTAGLLDPDALLHRADLALHEAKAHGKGRFICFEPALEHTIGARLALQDDIKHAVQRNELMVFYQPIVSSLSLEIVAFEALLRWTSPHRGRVSPAEFIPAAEACGAINAIGAWTLRQACLEASRWPENIRIAVNLSPLQCRSSDLVAIVKDALAASGLAPQRLELEITESVLLSTTASVKKNITELNDIGIRLALDDFGTGFSSLSYLLKFPVDKIKIDRCFVKDLPGRLECEAVVDAVIGLAKRLGVTVTAEGVETIEQARYLTARSCDELQGFLFSPAIPVGDLDGLFGRSLGIADRPSFSKAS